MVKNYDSIEDYKKVVKSRPCRELLSGGDGECFLKGDIVYKIINRRSMHKLDPNTIITQSDVKSSYVLFPIDIFTCGDKFIGYTTKYVPGDVLLTPYYEDYYCLDHNEERVFNAAVDFIKEIRRLAPTKIHFYDLPCNVLFNGKKFFAIDTCEYSYVPFYDDNEIYELNKGSFCFALETEFYYDMTEKFEYYLEELRKEKEPVKKRVPRHKVSYFDF